MGITHLFTVTQNTTERVEERTNEQIRTWVSFNRKKGEVYVTLFGEFCELARACTRTKLPQKPLAMLTSVDCVLLLLLTTLSSWPFTFAFLCQLLSLSSLQPSFPGPFLVSSEILCLGPLCGFCAKTDNEILWPAPIQTEMNATYCVTNVIVLIFLYS